MESIGGLGANLCGKMLGELGALYLGVNSSNFSSYGSEKRGSPVKAYIRWCSPEKELRINSPITAPDILCIFHEGLLGRYAVLQGVTEQTRIILNTALSVDEAAVRYGITKGTLSCIDALEIAMKCKSRINMVMFGAIAKIAGFIPLELAEALCKDTVGKKYPALIDANLEGLRQGFLCAKAQPLVNTPQSPTPENMPSSQEGEHFPGAAENNTEKICPDRHFVWGYKNAPIGGTNPRPGSTVSNDLSASREGYIPLFLQEKCINCGLCDSTCPDMVFQFHPGIYQGKQAMVNGGLDYYHCKGCLRCVEVCPTQALVKALEKDYPKPWFVPNQDLLPEAVEYEKTASNSWITSDSYLTEKRVDGGVV